MFTSSDFKSTAVLKETIDGNTSYLAYMSRGCSADAFIKAFALEHEIQSCPFTCSSFEQLINIGSQFDKCLVICRNNDTDLERLANNLSTIFRHVEVVMYNPVVARLMQMKMQRPLRKLSSIPEE